jgi:hypothetical protein
LRLKANRRKRCSTRALFIALLRKYLEEIPDRFVAVAKPYEVALGGETFEVREHALINGKIEGLDFDTMVVPVEHLRRENGDNLDAIIGTSTMNPWEITLNSSEGALGLEGLKRRKFTEYCILPEQS